MFKSPQIPEQFDRRIKRGVDHPCRTLIEARHALGQTPTVRDLIVQEKHRLKRLGRDPSTMNEDFILRWGEDICGPMTEGSA